MRAALSTLDVVRPRDLAGALRALRTAGGRANLVPIAGGTDVYVALNAGLPAGERFLDLWHLRELRGVRVLKDRIEFGALATWSDIRDHASVRRSLPALAAAAAEIGALQIQNRGTIGGNIANASPAGDSLPVLLVHDAVVHVRSVSGPRQLPYVDFHRGYRLTAMEPDELITGIGVPLPPARVRTFFRKVGTRRAQSISKVSFAAALRVGRGGRIDHVRVALGSVAPVPVRARAVEALLIGSVPSRALADRARALLARDISPIDDVRSDRDYRLAVAGNVLAQALRALHPSFA
jgi:xanthine dehydrogenase small subunit